MKTATFIRAIVGCQGDQRLYRLSDPLRKSFFDESDSEIGAQEFVIVSAATVLGEPETYIFAASEDGAVTNWGELPGSFKGALDHEEALRGAGYVVPETCECCNVAITADNRHVSGGATFCSLLCEKRGWKAQEASR